MSGVFVVDAVRTPMGKLGGQLAHVRPDDMAAHVIRRLVQRSGIDPSTIEDVVWGAANQAGEDNRNVGRMAALLAGLPIEVAGATVNRLCGSGLQAVITASQALAAGWGEIMIAGGSESMSRAPYALAKADKAFATGPPHVFDTTLGWRFVNRQMRELHGVLSMGETAEEVASRYHVSREDQDVFALGSHQKAIGAQAADTFADEIVELEAAQDPRGRTVALLDSDEGPRKDTSLEALAKLPPVFRKHGTVTAGNSSPMNDGAAAVLLATENAIAQYKLQPMAQLLSSAVSGVHPDIMGIGPVPATQKALSRSGLTVDDLDLVELNEAFAAQALACVHELGIDQHIVNVNGGAIALGHPLGCSGARLLTTLVHELKRRGSRFGLATMCIGVGQGIAQVVERV